MNRIKNYFTYLLTGAIALSLSSCTSSTLANAKTDSVSLPAPETQNSSLTTQLDSTPENAPKRPIASKSLPENNLKKSSPTPAFKTVNLTIYQADNQCQNLVFNQVAVSASNPVDVIVEKILKQTDSGDFTVAGYRVSLNSKSNTATIDLRLPPNSQRQFVSLSNCEQLALFGSLRKTLTSNPQLMIKNVKFTNQGANIAF